MPYECKGEDNFNKKKIKGFYRVNYDERNWNLIRTQLFNRDPNQISTINRAQLLDDAFNLAWAGLLPYGTAFNLSAYLGRETEYLPWKSAFKAFEHVNAMLLRTPVFYSFKVRLGIAN